ncbi:MAG: PIG-L family deacetylase [Chloroflexi bacterium]|nr:PIG-L family deacetylase [Chloroflexota bacterium]MBI3168130.1 PIG-L family deacetylase [Chloroflexota bacterium]
MANPLKLLAILAHPDDESLGIGGTLAKYSAEGVETYLICATRGERGWNGPEDQYPGLKALGEIREKELMNAAQHLGIKEVVFLDYIDGDVDQVKPQRAISDITAAIRRIRPEVVVTFDLNGNYGHPDHIAVTQFATAALVSASSEGYQYPKGLPPHIVSKFYHAVDSIDVVEGFRKLAGGISMEIDGVERTHIGWHDWSITTRVDARNHFDVTWKAILCHQSQLPGYGPLVDAPRETLEGFFGEGTFIRIFSHVTGGRKLEHDLFEGLR